MRPGRREGGWGYVRETEKFSAFMRKFNSELTHVGTININLPKIFGVIYNFGTRATTDGHVAREGERERRTDGERGKERRESGIETDRKRERDRETMQIYRICKVYRGVPPRATRRRRRPRGLRARAPISAARNAYALNNARRVFSASSDAPKRALGPTDALRIDSYVYGYTRVYMLYTYARVYIPRAPR